jgi:hypothetical protein
MHAAIVYTGMHYAGALAITSLTYNAFRSRNGDLCSRFVTAGGRLDIGPGDCGHAQISTTKLYDRSQDRVTIAEIRKSVSPDPCTRDANLKRVPSRNCDRFPVFVDFTRHLSPVTVTCVPVFVTAGAPLY